MRELVNYKTYLKSYCQESKKKKIKKKEKIYVNYGIPLKDTSYELLESQKE